MNSQLELTALMIPRPGMLPVPLVRTLYLFDKCLNICHPWPHVSCPQFPGSGNSLASSQRDTGSRSPQRLLLFLQTPASTCRRGCPSAHPASFLCTSMLVLQPPSELPRTLSKNAFSSQLSQRWLSRLQGMPEKKWASLDLKPRCPNLDPWVEAIKLKTGEWSNVRFQGMSSQLGPGPERGAGLAAGSCPALSPVPLKPPPCTGRASPHTRDQSGSCGTSASGCPHRGPQSHS